jgi:cytochrome c-type biogenesis protein CcmH
MSRVPIFKRFLKYALYCSVVAVTAITFQSVRAQQATPSDDEVNAIAREMFCPICENIPLDVCPTDACRDWRELIRQMLAQGKSPDEIKLYFVEHYGARVLSEPPMAGLNWAVYIIPPLIILLGGFLLFRLFRIWMQTRLDTSTGVTARSESVKEDEYTYRFEEELRKRQ